MKSAGKKKNSECSFFNHEFIQSGLLRRVFRVDEFQNKLYEFLGKRTFNQWIKALTDPEYYEKFKKCNLLVYFKINTQDCNKGESKYLLQDLPSEEKPYASNYTLEFFFCELFLKILILI